MIDSAAEADLHSLLKDRERKCEVARVAYENWLGLLTPIRWLTVSGGVILPLVAGLLVSGKLPPVGHSDAIAAVCSFAAATLTGLHTALGCDAHQIECRKLIQRFSSLRDGFQRALIVSPEDSRALLQELDAKFVKTREETMATPPTFFLRKAEKEVSSRPEFNSFR